MIAILAVGATLAGLLWQSHRALRADLSAGLREAKEDRERIRAEGRGDRERIRAEGREDRERLRADMNGRMDRFESRLEAMDVRIDARMNQMDARMDAIDARFDGVYERFDGVHERMDGIHGVLREQGERLSRVEGMLHLHLGRNDGLAPPPAPAE